MAKKSVKKVIPRWRYYLVMLGLASLPVLVTGKIAQLQVMPNEERGVDFLQTQGDVRAIREEVIPAYRGLITDRNGPLDYAPEACPEILRPRGASSRPVRKKSSCRAGIRSGTRLSQLAISNPTTILTPSGGEAQVIAFGVEQNAASFRMLHFSSTPGDHESKPLM